MPSGIYDKHNLFAKILRGEIDSIKFYEDKYTVAIMDIMPQSKGHCLILPKTKARNILDIDPHDLQIIILRVQTVAKACMKAFSADGVVIMQHNEPAAGQSIFHMHFHIIPRFNNVPLKPHDSSMVETAMLIEQAMLIEEELKI